MEVRSENLIIIHTGTNDIQNNVNTLQKIRKVISSIKEYDNDDNIKISFFSIIHRSDHDFDGKVSFSSVSHLRNLRSKNAANIIFFYLNINSGGNKFENRCELVAGNVEILCIAETKLDPSFPNSQFLIPGFHKPLRMDVSSRRGELLVYIKSSLPSKIINKLRLPNNIQIIPFKLNLRKDKWLVVSIINHLCKTINISSVF